MGEKIVWFAIAGKTKFVFAKKPEDISGRECYLFDIPTPNHLDHKLVPVKFWWEFL